MQNIDIPARNIVVTGAASATQASATAMEVDRNVKDPIAFQGHSAVYTESRQPHCTVPSKQETRPRVDGLGDGAISKVPMAASNPRLRPEAPMFPSST